MEKSHARLRRVGVGFALAVVLAALSGGTASAMEVDHTTSRDAFGFTDPAGTLCPFAVRLHLVAIFHTAEYSDTGTLVRIVDHVSQFTTFTNVHTSTTVSRDGVYIVTSYPDAGSVTRGLFGEVFASDGTPLFTDAGRVVYNSSLDIVSVTPHAEGERFQSLLCAALS